MTYRQSLVIAALSAGCVVGCNKKSDETTSVQTPNGSATVTTPTPDANTAQSTVDNIKGATDTAMQNAKDYTAKATGQADTTTAAAQDKLAQAVQYIKDNKYDLADKSLGELEGMKDKLPGSINKQVETARAQLTALKASNGAMGGLKMPGQ